MSCMPMQASTSVQVRVPRFRWRMGPSVQRTIGVWRHTSTRGVANSARSGGCKPSNAIIDTPLDNFQYISEITRPDYGRRLKGLMRRLITENERSIMKIVVIGGSGLIGSKLVTKLGEQGRQAVAASPNTGVNSVTGEGLAEVLEGASVVVDVSNAPSWEDEAVMKFFETSTRNLLAYEADAGVGHHVALSVVGSERLLESGYFRAKIAQENLIKASSIPYSIVRATQFFEFVKGIA